MDFRRRFFYAADYVDFAYEVRSDSGDAPLREALSEFLELLTQELRS